MCSKSTLVYLSMMSFRLSLVCRVQSAAWSLEIMKRHHKDKKLKYIIDQTMASSSEAVFKLASWLAGGCGPKATERRLEEPTSCES